ncbi:MAG: hypothetical protein NDJ89_08395 [Oligoflexia bacterium]|nr:hypothetical protein [Oligoflexia bacterium]
MDLFTRRRIARFIEDHRARSGQLPTFQDFEKAGIEKTLVKDAIREKLVEEFYLTLTNGAVVKGFKVAKEPG